MPVLQWGMLCVLSLLLSIGFLALHLPGGTPAWPDDRRDHLQYARSHSATPPAFLAAQAILAA